MRSSIACIRCRRSKVKCVNSGVGTTCRACDNAGRECVYPAPIAGPGDRRRSVPAPRSDAPPTITGAAAAPASASATPAANTTTAPAANAAPNSSSTVGVSAAGPAGVSAAGGAGLETERRQRPRKNPANLSGTHQSAGARRRDSPRPSLDALDPKLLTPAVWQELFDIFLTHYSADLPFLHAPTFLRPLRAAPSSRPRAPTTSGDSDSAPTPVRPSATPVFLLAFLALTARFHPVIVAHHSPPTATRASNPVVASQYYAAAATDRLSAVWIGEPGRDIERTQALLMLGLHEWGMCSGAKAWLTIGAAIRSAQALGLQFEADLNDEPWSRSLALGPDADRAGDLDSHRRPSEASSIEETDEFVRQETRRRTFWSCYIMDRHLSSGVYRPQMLRVEDLRIQLPASERSFIFAERVRTLMLGEEERIVGGREEVQGRRLAAINIGSAGRSPRNRLPPFRNIAQPHNDEDRGRVEIAGDEGLVSRYIRILDIYGRVVKWSCSGGRQNEQYPPWDSRCRQYQLYQQCVDFRASLPRQHLLTPQNTQAHINLKTATPYALVHLVYLLSQIILHRDYLPFVPLSCSRPDGPLDPPVFPSDRYDVPPRFWESAARECFRSAREILDLARALRDWSAAVETPIFAFAVYNVAFLGVYSVNFPWMDPDGFLCTPSLSPTRTEFHRSLEINGFEATRKALEILGSTRGRLRMANGWFKTAARVHRYFRRVSRDYRGGPVVLDPSSSPGQGSRDTEPASEEVRLLEQVFKDFARSEVDDDDVEMAEAGGRAGSSPGVDPSHDDSSAVGTVKSEDADARAGWSQPVRSEGGPWNAINATSSSQLNTPSSGQFRNFDSYRTSAQPQSELKQQPTSGQPNYPHPITNFRASYPSYDQPPQPSAGLRSPPPKPAPSVGQPVSPSFERSAYHGSRHSHSQSQSQSHSQYQSPAVQSISLPAAHTNGVQMSVHAPLYPVTSSGYMHQPILSSSSAPQPPPHSTHPSHQQQQPLQTGWLSAPVETYQNSLDTRLGGDDLAAFIEGGDVAQWAALSSTRADGGGWLSAVWTAGETI